MMFCGYMIGLNGVVDLQIIVNKFYVDVFQGNVCYNIVIKVDIVIIVIVVNGMKMIKNYCVSYFVEGVFQVLNKNIVDVVNSVLIDIIVDMVQDISIYDFIK